MSRVHGMMGHKYDTKAELLRGQVKRAMGPLGCSSLLVTEVSGGRRKKAIRGLARVHGLGLAGVTITTGQGEGPGEVAILTDRSTLKRLRRNVKQIAPGGGKLRLSNPIFGVWCVTEARASGQQDILGGAHLPAHVEMILRAWYKSGRKLPEKRLPLAARRWLTAVRGLAHETKQLSVAFPKARIIIRCDWNVNADEPWARALILSLFAQEGMGRMRIVRGPEGTLKGSKRVIDFFITDADLKVISTIALKGIDHKLVLAKEES